MKFSSLNFFFLIFIFCFSETIFGFIICLLHLSVFIFFIAIFVFLFSMLCDLIFFWIFFGLFFSFSFLLELDIFDLIEYKDSSGFIFFLLNELDLLLFLEEVLLFIDFISNLDSIFSSFISSLFSLLFSSTISSFISFCSLFIIISFFSSGFSWIRSFTVVNCSFSFSLILSFISSNLLFLFKRSLKLIFLMLISFWSFPSFISFAWRSFTNSIIFSFTSLLSVVFTVIESWFVFWISDSWFFISDSSFDDIFIIIILFLLLYLKYYMFFIVIFLKHLLVLL